jgi:hypothetical protein
VSGTLLPGDTDRQHDLPAAATHRSAILAHDDPYVVLRSRDFRIFVCSSMVSVIGAQVQACAIGWELWDRTGDTMMLGLVGLVKFLPVLIFTLPAGQIADWFDRKRILIASHLVSVVAALSMAHLSFHKGPLSLFFGCILLRSVASTFGMTARAALLPRIVPRAIFSKAVTWNSSVFELALAIGPALGGFILLWFSPFAAYLFDAACLLLAALLTAILKPAPGEKSTEPATLSSFMAGLHFVHGTKQILAAITLDMFAVLFGGATALLPIYAKDILHVGPAGFGWLRAAPAIGAVCMAVIQAHRRPLQKAGRSMLLAVAGFGIATIVFGLSTSFVLSLVMLLLIGALDNISVVVRHTMVQMLTPDSMRGRVSAVNGMFIGASNQLGEFESGVAAKVCGGSTHLKELLGASAGPVGSVVTGGIGTILAVTAVAVIWPQMRQIGALHDLKPQDQNRDREGAAASAAQVTGDA